MNSEGNELYRMLIHLTGLEQEKIQRELNPLLARLELSPDTLTMDGVRKVMLVYLEECSAHMQMGELETIAELDLLSEMGETTGEA